MTRKWLMLVIMSLLTVSLWIIIEVSIGLMSNETELDYQGYLDPIEPTFDEESLENILTREEEHLVIEREALQ